MAPVRQPRSPPPNVDIQAFEGFARFLKEHTSPRSKRVTAGGRVVSAGPNSPPPTFHTEFIDRLLVDCDKKKSTGTSQPLSQRHTAKSGAFASGSSSDIKFIHQRPMSTPAAMTCIPPTSSAKAGEPNHSLNIPPHFKVVQVLDGGKTAIVVNNDTVLRGQLGPDGSTKWAVLQEGPVRDSQLC